MAREGKNRAALHYWFPVSGRQQALTCAGGPKTCRATLLFLQSVLGTERSQGGPLRAQISDQ